MLLLQRALGPLPLSSPHSTHRNPLITIPSVVLQVHLYPTLTGMYTDPIIFALISLNFVLNKVPQPTAFLSQSCCMVRMERS